MAKLTGPLMGVNDAGKVWNQKVAKSQIVLILLLLVLPVKYFIPPYLSHGSRYYSTNSMNELRLLISSAFQVNKNRPSHTLPYSWLVSQLIYYRPYTGVSVSSPLI